MTAIETGHSRGELLALLNGQWTTQAICTAAVLGLPALLARQPRSAASLALATGSHQPSLLRLLRYLMSVGLVALRDDERFELTAAGLLLDPAAPNSLHPWAMLRHQRWPAREELEHSVRSGRPFGKSPSGGDNFGELGRDAEAAALFHNAMVSMTRHIAAEVLEVIDLRGSATVVDVGGGSGELVGALLKAHPGLRGIVFDLEHARHGAQTQITDGCIGERCRFVAGSFFDSVPAGHDVYLLKSVLHNWDDERAACILSRCRDALAPSARLLIVERVLPREWTNCADHRSAAASDLRMLVGLSGRERSEEEFAALLAGAMLQLRRIISTGGEFDVIEARAN